ncbi:hypothetical protein [Leisingera daeponensis]|uniref:hypothetical protein n=1 Tax=Leisingera daeponensis TaxID=405746 RepID=UPI001C965E69|nr:hypothetical protein [Leisingera daeponensis]MBY6058832.1 hypothetical protein [Leisingera daeponensis]
MWHSGGIRELPLRHAKLPPQDLQAPTNIKFAIHFCVSVVFLDAEYANPMMLRNLTLPLVKILSNKN